MKTRLLCCLLLASVYLVNGQPAHGGRHYVNKLQGKTAPAPPAPPAAGQPPVSQNSSNQTKSAAPIHQKTAEEKQEIIERTVEYQRKRAEAGNDTAQYDYGMRFLRGEGVEKNVETARKWLERSANQGNSLAKKQLEDLDKKPAADPEKPKQ